MSAIPFSTLVRVFSPRQYVGKPLLMLTAYFDESGHESTHELIVLAGFLGMAEEWETFDREWSDLLNEYELPYFHAKEMNIDHGPLCKGWTDERMISFMDRAVSAITKRDLLGISAGIDIEAYREVIAADPWLSRFWGSAYAICCHLCIQRASNYVEGNGRYAGEKLAIVFSSNAEFGGAARLAGEKYIDRAIHDGLVVSVKMASMEYVSPLQAADMIASESLKYWNRPASRTPRIPFARMQEEAAMAPLGLFHKQALYQLSAMAVARESDATPEAKRHVLAIGRTLVF